MTLTLEELKEKIRIGRQSCHHMGHSFVEAAELVFLKKDKKSKDRFIVNGLEHLQEAYKKEKGVCLLTLHLGNPDFSIVGVGLHDIKLNVISKDFSIDWLNNIWFGLRERFGTQFIKSKNSAYHILKALKRNEAVVFVQDQFMPHPHGIRTQFFGKYTGTAAGLAALSFRSGAPVVPVYAYRDGEGKTVIVFEKEIRFQRSDNYVEDLLQFTQLCNHKLEEIVLKKPEQWMWVHRRWKKFPKK